MTEPYYQDEWVTLYHGRCEDVLPTLSGVDLVVADPPYNYGVQYDGYADQLTPDEYTQWCGEWFALCRTLGRSVVIFPGHGNLPVWFGVERPSAIGCWYKPGNPASSHLGWSEWEPWLYWGVRLGGSDVLRATVSKQPDTGDHPCPKPIGLLTRLLTKAKAESVVDPFMGSGSTIVAAKRLGIRAVGVDQSEAYCEIAAKRLAQGVFDFGAGA